MSKHFSFFNNKLPASWVLHISREFHTCYSCWYYSSMETLITIATGTIFSESQCSSASSPLKNVLKVLQNSQENICTGVSFFLTELQVEYLKLYFKKNFQCRYFPVYIMKFLRTLFYRTHQGKCFCLSQNLPLNNPWTPYNKHVST